MTRADLQWTELADFTPGIYQNLGRSLVGLGDSPNQIYGPAPIGSATIEDTYGCIALPGGGIGPLPAMDWQYVRPNPNAGVTTWQNVRFSAYGPVYSSLDFAPLTHKHAIEFIFHFVSASPNDRYLVRDRVWEVSSNGKEIAAGNIDTLASATAEAGTRRDFITYFAQQTINPSSPSLPGNPVTLIGFPKEQDNAAASFLYAFPDPVTPASTTPVVLNASGKLIHTGAPIAHQNRILIAVWRQPVRASSAYASLGDVFYWSQPNTWAIESTDGSIFGPEEPVGYGTWVSLTASDLLIVKHRDGAVLLQSDVNYPIARKMPAVVSTGGQESDGALGPAGFCYLVDSDGVYAFSGESSRLLSPQLPPEFWDTYDGSAAQGRRPQLAWWGEWLMCPNGFMYSAELDYNKDAPTLFWSWRSQPIFIPSPDRIVNVREIVLVAQGAGKVTVSLLDPFGVSDDHDFDFDSTDTPVVLRRSAATRGSNHSRVKITSSGAETSSGYVDTYSDTYAGGPSKGAPIVYKVRLGWETASMVTPG